MSLAQDERSELVRTLTAAGENAPTLCGDWTARDLAAHLVVRERRLDAGPGIFVPFLSGYTDKVQADVAARPFDDLVHEIRTGPPIWSPFKLIDPIINVSEMFVHHEDVRRAEPGWTTRTLSAGLQNRLWTLAGLVGRLGYSKSPVGVTLKSTDGRTTTVKKAGGRSVVLTGEPSELALHAFGRSAVDLEFEGSEADVSAVQNLDRSF